MNVLDAIAAMDATELRGWAERHAGDVGETGMAARGFVRHFHHLERYVEAVDAYMLAHLPAGRVSPEDFELLTQERSIR